MLTVQTKGKRSFVTVAVSHELAAELEGWRATQVVKPSFSATVEAMTRLGLQIVRERAAGGTPTMMIPGPGDIEPPPGEAVVPASSRAPRRARR